MTYNGRIPHLLKSDPGWIARRKRILEQEPFCRSCAELGYQTQATTVDHIIPRSRGGGHEDSNLQPLCGPCHDAKTAREKHGGLDDRRVVSLDGSRHGAKREIEPRKVGTSARAKFVNRSYDEEK
jgi:hypothetical protein